MLKPLIQKNSSIVKTPSSKSLILVVSFYWGKKRMYMHSLISLKLVIVGVAFFLDHPVYIITRVCQNENEFITLFETLVPFFGGGGWSGGSNIGPIEHSQCKPLIFINFVYIFVY